MPLNNKQTNKSTRTESEGVKLLYTFVFVLFYGISTTRGHLMLVKYSKQYK